MSLMPSNGIKAGNIQINVGMPSLLTQIINGDLVKRWLTIKPLCEFYELNRLEKCKIIFKTATVGLLALGIAASVAFMSALSVYAVPLCLVVTLGLAFNFLSEEAAAREKMQKQAIESVASRKTVTIKPDVIVIE